MSSYPNILTPPSSNEDSPQPVYYVDSNSFQEPEVFEDQSLMEYSILPKAEVSIPSMTCTFPRATLHILEQPTDRFRFRYKSEMAGTHGSLTGYTSDKSRKQTYPTVEIRNCTGPAIIRCSIYQLNEKGNDMKPHAHRLIMKRGKDELDDPHDLAVGPEDGWKAVFHGMGIIHTAKKNIVGELEKKKIHLMKEYIARTEGAHRELKTKEKVEIKGLAESESKSINLNIVCLRFDAFIKQNGILYPICEPAYSHGINNLKSALTGDLKIVRLDHVVCEAKGNKEVYLLVERVTKKNIKIRFYELNDEDRVVWEAYGKFNDLDVHHQYAIVFRTPMYRDQNITRPVKVFIELVRPSDNARSEPRDFRYIPNKKQPKPGQKRARYDYSSSSYDSSNLGSDELPVVVNNLNSEPAANVVANINVPSGLNLSEDIIKAMNSIGSEEFQNLYNELGSEFETLFAIDAPKLHEKGNIRRIRAQEGTNKCVTRVPIKIEVSQEDKSLAIKVLEELKSFTKTKYNHTAAIEILNHYLGEDLVTNALHVCICQNDLVSIKFILEMMVQHRRLNLINIQNSDSKTYLHLAVMTQNEEIVRNLLLSKARISTVDNELNTPLHVAVQTNAPVRILGMLLSNRESESVNDYIDKINTDGNTALMLAIENKNLNAMKLLCTMKADVNMIHSKDGFVPLRLAIEKEYLDGVKYLLNLPQVDATIEDFGGISPIMASMQKDPSGEIYRVVNDYKIRSHINIEVKEEIETDEEMEFQEEPDIKPIISLSDVELKNLYEKHDNFTSHCLDEVSAILDASGKWEHLAELLDIRHLIDNVISSKNNVSKAMLTLAIETNNDTLWDIRNFLESLDELRAVEIMDRMVQNFC